MGRPLRILEVISGIAPGFGGPSKVVHETCTALAHLGHDVELLATNADTAGFIDSPVGETHWHGNYRRFLTRVVAPKSPHWSPRFVNELNKRLKHIDIVHVHGLFSYPTSMAMRHLRKCGVPYVVRPCGHLDHEALRSRATLKHFWFEWIDRRNVDGAAFVQAATPLEEREMRRSHLQAPVFVIPQGVDVERLPSAPRVIEGDYFLFLGRIHPIKGLDLLLEAYALEPTLPALAIAGSCLDGYRDVLKALAQRLGLTQKVIFLDDVRGEAKSALLRDARALVLPSRSENFGVVVVEAAGHGTPIVLTETVGLAEFVVSDEAGIVVPRNARSLAQALQQMNSAPRSRWLRGTEQFAARFHWSESAKRLESAMLRALGKSATASASTPCR